LTKKIIPYIISQALGGMQRAGILYVIATSKSSFDIGGFAANGYAEHSPNGYNIISALVTKIIMPFMFLMIILGITHSKAPKGFAGLAIGLGLALIHLISIPVTNTLLILQEILIKREFDVRNLKLRQIKSRIFSKLKC